MIRQRTNPPLEDDTSEQQPLNNLIKILTFEAFKSEGYLTVNKSLIKVMGLVPAVLLSNYIDKHLYFEKKYPDNDGWFYLTHEQQIDQLNIGETVIRKYKHYLVKQGILTIKRRGVPSKEWLKIHIEKLNELVLSGLGLALRNSEGLTLENQRAIYNNNKNKNNERNKIFVPYARQIARVVLTKKNMKFTTKQINSWANSIRLLSEENDITSQRIKAALDSYEEYIDHPYMVVIESGQSLREKFIRLEAAIERAKNPYKHQPVNTSGSRRFREPEKYNDQPDAIFDGDTGKFIEMKKNNHDNS